MQDVIRKLSLGLVVLAVTSCGEQSRTVNPNFVASSAIAPTPGGAISFSNVTSASLDLTWVASIDDLTASDDLEYRVYRSTSANISTVSDAEANGTALTEWTENLLTLSVAGLSEASVYFFIVLVRDSNANVSNYDMVSTTTTDVTGPIAGTAIQFASVTAASMLVSWGVASDNLTGSAKLEYRGYLSTANNVTSFADAEANGTLVLDWTEAQLNASVLDLDPNTQYFVNVFVRDEQGLITGYGTQSQTTLALPVAIYFFVTDTTHDGNLGNRAASNALCATARTNAYPGLPSDNVLSFISYTGDGVADFVANQNVPGAVQVAAPDGVILASNYTNFLGIADGLGATLAARNLLDSAPGEAFFAAWAGFFSTDFFDFAKCNDWTSSDGAVSGRTTSANSNTWGDASANCNQARPIQCLSWNN